MLDFLGIGAQKAATTWLFEQLARHPQLGFPAGKEVHFWDQKRSCGVSWWLGLFDHGPPGVRQGEITPAYALLERADVERIREHVPGLRIFYSLRNPAERAWSAALMALGRAELVPEEASDQWFMDHFRSRGSLGRGDYVACLERWTSVFPREQLSVFLVDDIARDPRAVLRGLATHIGVAPDFYDTVPDEVLSARIHVGPSLPVRRSLRPGLRAIYAPRLDALEGWLGRDLALWRRALE